MRTFDVAVVGAGHNGLVAAVFLARAGLDVIVVERASEVGGATRTEYPFAKVPGLGHSTGAYLLGLMPPELMQKLDVNIPVLRRNPHYFLPTTGERYLAFGGDAEATRDQFLRFFSDADWRANQALEAELGKLRDDVAPTWLSEPLSVEDTADRYVRPELRDVFVNLCRGNIDDYLARFEFESELIETMYAVTDAFSGSFACFDTPGSGHNFLVHNMCRLPGSDGTWMVVKGGMGTVSSMIADKARAEGATIETSWPIASIEDDPSGFVLHSDGHDPIRAAVVVGGCDPFTLAELCGDTLSDEHHQMLEGMRVDGTTMKVNLALRELPTFKCLAGQNVDPYQGTMHILPDDASPKAAIQRGFDAVVRGELADFPTIEWYVHTTLDPSLSDEDGHHSSALFVQWVPRRFADGSGWDASKAESYAHHLLSLCDIYAPGTSDLVADMLVLTPDSIEERFGIRYGHIHHVDNRFAFADRHPYATHVEGLYSCSAGCHPAGSVIGAAGHNAAMRVLKDMGI